MDPGASAATTPPMNKLVTVIVEGTTHKLYTYFGDGSDGALNRVASDLDALPASTPAIANLTIGTGTGGPTPPPSPTQVSLTLNRQPVIGGFVPYTGTFPVAGGHQPYTLKSITVRAEGLTVDTAVSFVKVNHSTLG